MKRFSSNRKFMRRRIINCLVVLLLMLNSCQKYLDQTPEVQVTDQDVFTEYKGFQGFVDQCYMMITDYNQTSFTASMNIGGLFVTVQNYSSAKASELGDYRHIVGDGTDLHNVFWATETQDWERADHGIYISSWRGIRAANLALDKLHLLSNATEEEKQLIEGQAYFFRAFFYLELARCFGGLPYIDKLLLADDDLQIPRLSYLETTERIVEDFDKAASLLPESWDDTEIGSKVKGTNDGRATKGAALAFKARALLYAGSPLMVNEEGGGFNYDLDLMKRAAEAAAKVIEMANRGVYALVPFENYQDNFAKNDGTYPFTTETVFARSGNGFGSGRLTNFLGRNQGISRLGGNAITECPTQNLVDAFEMSNGLPYDDPASGYNPLRPWEDRDPRFKAGIYVDRDYMTIKRQEDFKLNTYLGGSDNLQKDELRTPYLSHKFQPLGVNNRDQEWTNFVFVTPLMRLAEVYLMYAEAVNEFAGPDGTTAELSLTALDAVNIVRNRANMPSVNTKFTSNKENFRERIRNERTVEFFAEGHRWYDIRRWHIGHEMSVRELYSMEFDKDWTFFNRVKIGTMNFEERHYWLPFPRRQTQIYPGFHQNSGW